MKKYIKPENWIHGMSLEKKGLLKSQQTNHKEYLPKWWSIITWLIIGLAFSHSSVLGQTYTVGDVVNNFGTVVCENGDGDWNYNTDGLGKVTWLNIFTSW
tara:strand:+ start:243 stop:542 length:300 start_codon:yes stop_codon:yes gene_type:complete